jgi:Cu-Zn family superoxide dismutase
MTHTALTRIPIVAVAALVAGCATLTQPATTNNTATARVQDASGRAVGTATFTEVSGGVKVLLETNGLPPGPHGVHIHEVGKCEPPGFTTAGNHFNPEAKQHGALNPQGQHAGDLPNLTVGTDGSGRLEAMSTLITLGAGPKSILDADGSALVVHAAPDDFRTDPTGNSGARIACGVITREPR